MIIFAQSKQKVTLICCRLFLKKFSLYYTLKHIIPGAIGILSIIEKLLINLLLCFVVHHFNNQYWYIEILKNNKYLTSQSKESIKSITIWVNCVQSKLRKEFSEKGLSYAQGDCDCHDCVQTRRERGLYNSVADVMQHGHRCGRRVGSGRLHAAL